MARARNIKPGFFTNDDLVEFDFATRLLFIGLWTVADKAGRLEDRPKKIKMAVFPADDVDIEPMLASLSEKQFIRRYEVSGAKYIQIVNWSKHQNPHHTEKASVIPECCNGDITVKQPSKDEVKREPNGGNLADSLIHRFTDPSEPKGSGGKPPKEGLSPDAILFGYGVPYLVECGSKESNARSFIGKLRKLHGDEAVIDKLRACLRLRPSQPIEWLAAALPPEKAPQKVEWHETQSGIEQMGDALGLGRWNEMAWKAGGFRQDQSFNAYKARVMAAHQKGAH